MKITALVTTIGFLGLALNPLSAQKAAAPADARRTQQGSSRAQEARLTRPTPNATFPPRPFFGDTHLHTSQSFDAIAFGCRLGPEDAYRFARGEQVTSSTGQPARLSRPLDFLVVADHSENMGTMGEILAGNPAVMCDERVRRWHEMLNEGGESAMKVYYEMMAAVGGKGGPLPAVLTNPQMTRSIWEKKRRCRGQIQ